ncbi:MAG: HD domain-containing protein [Ignavibacteriales bacterium]|nr:HD domain-containing protein [Ignavibacteriales bacterium]
MLDKIKIRKDISKEREKIFNDPLNLRDAYKTSALFSMFIENSIKKILASKKTKIALASVGSFSRYELSPYSDIDVIFICESVKKSEDEIQNIITSFWDSGIEVSHTVREFTDIEKFKKSDLHTFTQFFETKFLGGNKNIYKQWRHEITTSLNEELRRNLILDFFTDIKKRLEKYGKSPKVLEPNVKYTAGGLRSVHDVEWIYLIRNILTLDKQTQKTQTELFLKFLRSQEKFYPRAVERLYNSYNFVLKTRNLLHIISGFKNDRLEFDYQEKIAKILGYEINPQLNFMKEYFTATNVLHRFSKTWLLRFEEEISPVLSDYLTIKLDDDFSIKGRVISISKNRNLNLSEILRTFYYRGLYEARFDQNLRSLIIENIQEMLEEEDEQNSSSAFFREILRLPKNVSKVLTTMNELNVLSAYLPEFKDMVGFFQPGVYHCYAADEHTLFAIRNLEKLEDTQSLIGDLFSSIRDKDILYLAVLLHDIGKPINLTGHEIIGAEIASSICNKLRYSEDEIELVRFLVRNHLVMEQTAFRRNIDDPVTLNNFVKNIPSVHALDMLYLITYADLSAVSPAVWTRWKNDLLNNLYMKSRTMLENNITGEELLKIQSFSEIIDDTIEVDDSLKEHIDAINNSGYLLQYTIDEINEHIDLIEKESKTSVLFKKIEQFTNITVITSNTNSLLAKLCGALTINDINIHDANIFTRKNDIAIDSFNVTDFRTHEPIEESRYDKIRNDVRNSVGDNIQINREFYQVKKKWWRLENKFFSRKGKIAVKFEPHDKYTIIDVFSPDRLGLLYAITKKISELGLSIHFAKIATKGDDVVDTFYVLRDDEKKVLSNQYELIRYELIEAIKELL